MFATGKRKVQAAIRRARELVARHSLSGYGLLFESILPAAFLARIDPTRRQRCFGHVPVFWAWLGQILEANGSCQRALGLVQSWYQACDLPAPRGDTSSYCQARLRLEEGFLEQIASRVSHTLAAGVRSEDRWAGMVLKAMDGSSVQLMDTEANQQSYPQPFGQKPGCGFPIMGMVGVLNLSHGGWEGFETCHCMHHDLQVAGKLLCHIDPDDLVLADRAFCSYELIARIMQRGAHVLMRLHQARHAKLDWRKGKRIGPHERIVFVASNNRSKRPLALLHVKILRLLPKSRSPRFSPSNEVKAIICIQQ